MAYEEELTSLCESILVESSLSRLIRHGREVGYIVVSACRHEFNEDENWKRTHDLKMVLDDSPYSYMESTGGFPEEDEDGGEVNVREHSFVVLPYSKSGELLGFDDLMNFGRFVCKKFGQQSILKTKEPENPMYVTPDNKVDMEFANGTEYNSDSPYFTALGRHDRSNLKRAKFRRSFSFK